ncbi:transcriptional regulator, LysR family [Rhizobium sp. PDO1-076]|uniref:LysR family transcriptional regulator n=1 Tax=Rhizobium sp. PDO1-076 TaxID=1125979 RepID=UPI00024E3023|nr:LysR family transcriptional regulator [Rhizobium sp. PDO1-076]EHS54119.1 transcriptional regulator, LysR family [Rhizobium sp. PDO1-076]
MVRPYLPLNALRAFEASARHLSFTRAAIELCVTQAAVSQQVKQLEDRLGTALFKRLPRGLMITEEGEALLPVLRESFDRIAGTLDRFEHGHLSEVVKVGAVGTFAVGWLLPRLGDFARRFPFVELRLSTNNNRVDMAAEGLDFAIRFGNGAWHSTEAEELFEAPLSPLCLPQLAARLKVPDDLLGETLLRSYRASEWASWFTAAGVAASAPLKGMVFDTSLAMIEAAQQGAGVALAPPRMFPRLLTSGQLVQPFAIETGMGSYWLTRLKSRPPTTGMRLFQDWLMEMASGEALGRKGC